MNLAHIACKSPLDSKQHRIPASFGQLTSSRLDTVDDIRARLEDGTQLLQIERHIFLVESSRTPSGAVGFSDRWTNAGNVLSTVVCRVLSELGREAAVDLFSRYDVLVGCLLRQGTFTRTPCGLVPRSEVVTLHEDMAFSIESGSDTPVNNAASKATHMCSTGSVYSKMKC